MRYGDVSGFLRSNFVLMNECVKESYTLSETQIWPITWKWCKIGPLDNIRVMVIVWRLRGNIIRTAVCWVVWHNVHSQQHTHVSSSHRSSRSGLSHWDPYAMHRGGWLELYCNMMEWSWWESSLIWKTNWLPSVLWHCWFGHMTCKKTSPIWSIMCLVGR